MLSEDNILKENEESLIILILISFIIYSMNDRLNSHHSQEFPFTKNIIFQNIDNASLSSDMDQYVQLLDVYNSEMFCHSSISEEVLSQHRIKLMTKTDLSFREAIYKLNKSDSLFSVVQTHFHGL